MSITASVTKPSTPQGLTKSITGEITASSVQAHPELAAGLIKLKDGNYAYPIVSASDRFEATLATVTLPRSAGAGVSPAEYARD